MKQDSFLVVKCTPLNDQYETDAHREPLCITADEGEGYEVYHMNADGKYKKSGLYEVFQWLLSIDFSVSRL